MARLKSSSTTRSYSLLLIPSLVVLALAVASGSSSPVSVPYPYTSQLKYYVHLLFGDVSLATNFLPPLDTSLSANFGMGNLFAFNVTQGTSRTSKHLGFVRGFTVQTSYLATDQNHGLEVAFVEYNDGHYNGTIQIQGRVQSPGTEVAIVGGTGSFRGARGFLGVSLVKVAEPYQLYCHELHFL